MSLVNVWLLWFHLYPTFVTSAANDTPWPRYNRFVEHYTAITPVLIVFSDFAHELDLFKAHPAQQILSNPPDVAKNCPYDRILILSSLSRFGMLKRRHMFHLCPLGTVYYILNDLQLRWTFYATINTLSPKQRPKKSLMYGVEMYDPYSWDRYLEPPLPFSWTDEFLSDRTRASPFDLRHETLVGTLRYTVVLKTDNETLRRITERIGLTPEPVWGTLITERS